MTDLDQKVRELRALAEKATPGEWKTAATDDSLILFGQNKIAGTFAQPGDDWGYDNAAYIAAANPATLTAILDEHDRRGAALKTICTERCDPYQVAHEALSREVGK